MKKLVLLCLCGVVLFATSEQKPRKKIVITDANTVYVAPPIKPDVKILPAKPIESDTTIDGKKIVPEAVLKIPKIDKTMKFPTK